MSLHVDLGHDHTYVRIVDADGNWIGINQFHLNADGETCIGFVPFDTPEAAESLCEGTIRWDLISFDPLHLEPSLQCRICGDHGWIRNGAWEPA